VGLILTADNKKVLEGFLVTEGKLETRKDHLETKHIWK
jgi:hypothetical protein